MTLSEFVVLLHVIAGGGGLLLAAPVLVAPKRRGLHTLLGRAFAGCVAVICATTFVLVAADPAGLAGLGVLGVLTGLWAGGGVWFARAKPRVPGGWYRWHLQLMCSAVIAFVTAFLVQVTDGSLVAWVAPTLVGSPLIARRAARATAPARPAAAAAGPRPGGPPAAGRTASRRLPAVRKST